MKLKVFFIALVNIFIIVMIVMYFKKEKSPKENRHSIITETKIDTFFQQKKLTLDQIDRKYNEWLGHAKTKKKESKKSKKKLLTKKSLSKKLIQQQLEAIESPMKFEYNRIVYKFISTYAFEDQYHTGKLVGLAEYYFPIFEEALHKRRMPLELKYLPVIESSLRTNAVSPVGATGLWQLMYNTAETYGLLISSYVDERREPALSTKAAVSYIKDLFGIYRDWWLTIAAYNCGPGAVNYAIRKADGNTNFWDIYHYLPKETRDYVPKFIAMVYTFKYHESFGIMPRKNNFPARVEKVKVSRSLHLKQIADWFKINSSQLSRLNPQYSHQIVPSTSYKKYTLKLPHTYASRFKKQEKKIYNFRRETYFKNELPKIRSLYSNETYYDIEGRKMITHTVKQGDVLSTIAGKYKVPVSALKTWNNIDKDLIKINQKLKIYIFDAPSPLKNNYSQDGNLITYTVKRGDVVGTIARKFSVTEASLRRWNNLKSDKIRIGQKLKIYAATKSPALSSTKNKTTGKQKLTFYTVKKGDVVGTIARKFGITEASLRKWNNLKNNRIYIGQRLRVAGK